MTDSFVDPARDCEREIRCAMCGGVIERDEFTVAVVSPLADVPKRFYHEWCDAQLSRATDD